MAHVCLCGDELTVHVTKDELTTYCQSCGSENKSPAPKGISSPKDSSSVISLSRASILKKINNKVTEEPKRPKQIRDRTNYMSQRGGRR